MRITRISPLLRAARTVPAQPAGATAVRFTRFASSEAGSSKPSPESKPTTTKGTPSEPKDPYAVPPLSRPLGVPVRPSSKALTWEQKKELMLDAERHKAKRQAL